MLPERFQLFKNSSFMIIIYKEIFVKKNVMNQKINVVKKIE